MCANKTIVYLLHLKLKLKYHLKLVFPFSISFSNNCNIFHLNLNVFGSWMCWAINGWNEEIKKIRLYVLIHSQPHDGWKYWKYKFRDIESEIKELGKRKNDIYILNYNEKHNIHSLLFYIIFVSQAQHQKKQRTKQNPNIFSPCTSRKIYKQKTYT